MSMPILSISARRSLVDVAFSCMCSFCHFCRSAVRWLPCCASGSRGGTAVCFAIASASGTCTWQCRSTARDLLPRLTTLRRLEWDAAPPLGAQVYIMDFSPSVIDDGMLHQCRVMGDGRWVITDRLGTKTKGGPRPPFVLHRALRVTCRPARALLHRYFAVRANPSPDRLHPAGPCRRACAGVFLPASFSWPDRAGAARTDSWFSPNRGSWSQQSLPVTATGHRSPRIGRSGRLQVVGRNLAVLALGDVEGDLLAFLEGAEAGALDSGNMNEHILGAVV